MSELFTCESCKVSIDSSGHVCHAPNCLHRQPGHTVAFAPLPFERQACARSRIVELESEVAALKADTQKIVGEESAWQDSPGSGQSYEQVVAAAKKAGAVEALEKAGFAISGSIGNDKIGQPDHKFMQHAVMIIDRLQREYSQPPQPKGEE